MGLLARWVLAGSDRDLGRQMRRAGTSVVLNLAESCATRDGNRRTRRETALGSLYETQACVDAGVAMRYVERGKCAAVRAELERIAAMIEALLRA